MKITYYGYNAFVIASGSSKIVIDPGALLLRWFRLTPLVPKTEWADATHILVTHGDPDHYWHADRVARASGAPVICHRDMVRTANGGTQILGPRSRGLAFKKCRHRVHPLLPGETLEKEGVRVTGIPTAHGPLVLRLGPFARTLSPGPGERVGWGSIGFEIDLDGKILVNLGDTLLMREAWSRLRAPDVLMLPIGGGAVGNTMDEEKALEAVRILQPGLVIPCHYNLPALFWRCFCPADDRAFKRAVEQAGARCALLIRDAGY